jgi:hypothetical protein
LTRADLRPGPLVPARAQRGILGSRVAPAAGLLLLSLGACTAYKSLVGENTVSLQGAEVTSMQVDIRRQEKKICRREPVQMWVRVEAKR